MQRLGIIGWKNTQGKYVGIIQDLQRFKADTLKPKVIDKLATVLEGELLGTYEKDWYCISLSREELEFDEARDRARAILENENQKRAQGRSA